MSYPPQNPYDPNQQPGFGQPSQPPRHFTTDSDPYSRPDSYGQNPYGGGPPMSVQPGSVPPNTPPGPPPTQGFQTGQAFQPGQPAPAPPRGSSNTPLMVTILVIVVALAIGGTVIAVLAAGGDDDADIADDTTGEATTAAEEETTEASPEPTEEETTDGYEAEYRPPEVDECIENVSTGFYVVPCDAEEAYWLVLHIEKNPDDPDPDDPMHNTAGHNACKDYDYTTFYYTDTALSAGRDWDPEIDSITAIYCMREVDG